MKANRPDSPHAAGTAKDRRADMLHALVAGGGRIRPRHFAAQCPSCLFPLALEEHELPMIADLVDVARHVPRAIVTSSLLRRMLRPLLCGICAGDVSLAYLAQQADPDAPGSARLAAGLSLDMLVDHAPVVIWAQELRRALLRGVAA